tara:strand:+ start:733 stop:1002 length:270 start_codon:yes stop_codon:yes gene_type:complete
MKIIYQTEEGLIVVTPTGEISINEVARKDVPAGVDYWIVEDNEIPTDRTFRNAWKLIDNIGPADGQAIGSDAWFAEQASKTEAEGKGEE